MNLFGNENAGQETDSQKNTDLFRQELPVDLLLNT